MYWPLHAFFYRTTTLAASGLSQQQILFSAESGIYCWQSHQFLLWTPLEKRVKRQKQPLKLLCKNSCFYKFLKEVTQKCSWEKVFWKYAADLQKNTHAEVRAAYFQSTFS